jgi:antagonist of KipI
MKSELTLRFKKAGLQTSIQDGGRFGYQSFGVPISGAMDQAAYHLANELLENPIESPVLELTLIGPEIIFSGNGFLVLTGSECHPKINQQSIPMNRVVQVNSEDVLSFGHFTNGCRAYLGVKGEWLCPTWLESYAALRIAANNFGRIRKGDIINIEASIVGPTDRNTKLKSGIILKQEIEVIPGPEYDLFPKSSLDQFFQSVYKIGLESNRIGYRLEGPKLNSTLTKALLSSAVVPGTIQITNAGLPIILMRDAQTTGGYPRIANVISNDLNILAQNKPGDSIKFKYKID